MDEKSLAKVFKKRNEVRKLMQDPLFYNKEEDESFELLNTIEDLLKSFKRKKK